MKLPNDIDLDMFDVMSYLDDRGIAYSQAGSKNVSEGHIGISCVFCGDHSNHLGINLFNHRISCWKCGPRGSTINLVMAIDGCSFTAAKRTILKFVATDFSHLVRRERLHADITKFPGGMIDEFLPMQDEFLRKRRYDPEYLKRKYDLMAIGRTMDDWKFRIIIPVYVDHELVTYLGRDSTDRLEVPYKNAPIEKSMIQAKHTLYGLDEITDTAVVVEGVFDKWRMGSGVVATFGTQMTPDQICLLARKKLKHVYMLFDADAVRKAEALAYSISSVVEHVDLILLDEGDPDNLEDDDVWEIRRELSLK